MTNTDQPYEQWRFFPADTEKQEILTALLSEYDFDGFEQRTDVLLAATRVGTVDADAVRALAAEWGVEAVVEIIQPQNWNARWESEYQPVVVPGWCTVRAHFHPPATDTPHEVIITPRMSFGTGHHATTWLMLDVMRELEFSKKSVLDFGTGTGVLAILAAKLGAQRVLAVDNDPWSVENAADNLALNDVQRQVEVVAGSLEEATAEKFDIILANINRHVLLQYMSEMRRLLRPGGFVLISGLLIEDEPLMVESARKAGLTPHPCRERAGWITLRLNA